MKTKHKIDNFELANNVIKKTNFNYKLFWKNENNLFQFGDSNELMRTALKNNLKYTSDHFPVFVELLLE